MTKRRPWILGLSSGWHNGAACLCRGAEIVVAIQEERLTRVKRAPLPSKRRSLAVEYCLAAAGIRAADLDAIVDCRIHQSMREQDEPIESIVGECRAAREVMRLPHHLGHALSVFCTSGFPDATVLVIDGGGSYGYQLSDDERRAARDFDETYIEHVSVYRIDRRGFTCVDKHMADMSYTKGLNRRGMPIFRSLGHMFSSVALQIFGDYLEAGKVMALAPCGAPTIAPEEFCTYDGRAFAFSHIVPQRFQHGDRWPLRREEYGALAASVQRALEQVLGVFLAQLPKDRMLCYAGGVALNSVANHNVVRGAGFPDAYVIPAAEDSGTAIGAAYYGLMQLSGVVHTRRLGTDALGRTYSRGEVDHVMAQHADLQLVPTDDLVGSCVDLLCDGNVIGWFQGGAEFGPRALGHRSILCDPRRPDAKDVLNSRVKHREAFRPFAPAVLAEHATRWFALDRPTALTDFMLEVCRIRSPGDQSVPAVTHLDGTGRLQTVTASNPRFHELIQAFYARTGVPMIVNTSMNVMGEPIVESPRDAVAVLLFTGLDYLMIEDRIVAKALSFTSPLDLIPRRTRQAESMLAADAAGQPTRSGRRPVQRLTAVLSRIDNTSSLRKILRDALPHIHDERKQVEIAQKLFRFNLVEFGAPSTTVSAVGSLR